MGAHYLIFCIILRKIRMKVIQVATSIETSYCIASAMEEKQGEDLLLLDLRALQHAFVDYFVLCTAKNEPHIDALITHIEAETYRRQKQRPWFIEGAPRDKWVLMDYVDVVVHVFTSEQRAYYALEELWGDAEILSLSRPKTTANIARI